MLRYAVKAVNLFAKKQVEGFSMIGPIRFKEIKQTTKSPKTGIITIGTHTCKGIVIEVDKILQDHPDLIAVINGGNSIDVFFWHTETQVDAGRITRSGSTPKSGGVIPFSDPSASSFYGNLYISRGNRQGQPSYDLNFPIIFDGKARCLGKLHPSSDPPPIEGDSYYGINPATNKLQPFCLMITAYNDNFGCPHVSLSIRWLYTT
jgi:hypothetical protein